VRLAASLERASEHPLQPRSLRGQGTQARIVGAYGFRCACGKGIQGEVDGRKLVIGNADFLYASGITTVELRGLPMICARTAPPSYSLALTVRPLAHRDCRSGQRVGAWRGQGAAR